LQEKTKMTEVAAGQPIVERGETLPVTNDPITHFFDAARAHGDEHQAAGQGVTV